MADTDLTDLTALDFDPEVAGLFNRPDYFATMARLRREAPVHEYAPRCFTVARYADVRAVSKDPARFCSSKGVLMDDPPRHGTEVPGSILHMDPPVHGAYRSVASRWFTPRAVSLMEEQVRATTRRILDELAVGDEIDVVQSISSPIPVYVIADLLGLSDTDHDDFRRWSDAAISGSEEHTEEEQTANITSMLELFEFLTDHTRARRTTPRDDLLTALATVEVNGRPMTDGEVVTYCLSLLVAGNETARHLISGSIAELHAHPDQRSALGADPAALPGAVEECLRWVTPIQTFGRTVTTPLELAGRSLEPGDWLVLLYAGANRDEEAFGPDAAQFDAFRPANPAHVAFGFGEHLCLGASLARLEGRVVLEEVLARFPHYELGADPTWVASTLVRGHHTLPALLA